jgi:hypothetical protein
MLLASGRTHRTFCPPPPTHSLIWSRNSAERSTPFGPERVMWASDYTMIRRANWGEALFSIRHSPSLSEDEKAWILDGTARWVLNWPPPQTLSEATSVSSHRAAFSGPDHGYHDHS